MANLVINYIPRLLQKMSQNNDTSQWGGPNGASADAAAKNPFGGRSGGPPVFFRSKNAPVDGATPSPAPARDTQVDSQPESFAAPVQSKSFCAFSAWRVGLTKLFGPKALQIKT